MSERKDITNMTIEVPRPSLLTNIVIGSSIIGDITRVVDFTRYTQFAVVSDRQIAPTIGSRLVEGLHQSSKPINTFDLEASEVNKTEEETNRVLDDMLKIKPPIDRKLLVFAVGGGVVGDMTGYIAGKLLRGVDYCQVPTTLLAMVDSSLGGKTAVDSAGLTNMVGLFHLPRVTVMDVDVLDSLDGRQFKSGLSEFIKHGFLEPETFEFVASVDVDTLKNDKSKLIKGLTLSAKYKMSIVKQDFEERTGIRKALNFGHTIGRALETATNLSRFTHGEAVSLGMSAALRISNRVGLLSDEQTDDLLGVLRRFNLMTTAEDINRERLWDAIKADKKSVGGIPKFVLLSGIGLPEIDQEVSKQIVDEALDEVIV